MRCLEDYFAGYPSAKRVDQRISDRYVDHQIRAGWCVVVDDFADDIVRELHVLIDSQFPYTPPRIAVADAPEILEWPHLERNGVLCMLPPDASVSVEHPVSVVKYLLDEACVLIDECICGINTDDFRSEFHSYWLFASGTSIPKIISIVDPKGPNRRIQMWRGKEVYVAGEDVNSLMCWMSRRRGKNHVDHDYRLHDSVLIWLPQPLIPAEYPTRVADIWDIARNRSDGSSDILEETAATGADEINIVFGAPTSNGACFGAVSVHPPALTKRSKGKRNLLGAGFRQGRVPKHISAHRYLTSTAQLKKHPVIRADSSWIHGRDQDVSQGHLRNKRVTVIGCGSLGGSIVKLLAQAGVGNLLLVDSATLDWPNVGRHVLGASSVGKSKSKELANDITSSYPHLLNVSGHHVRFGPGEDTVLKETASCDLIISTAGNWTVDSFVNDLQQNMSWYPPILYGWVEANAVAAHAVFVPQGDSCFRCGVNDKGRPILSVTDWPLNNEIKQEPACGALYTPYGPVELCWAHALIAETAVDSLTRNVSTSIHRIWIGSHRRVKSAGGTWSQKWKDEIDDPGCGNLSIERKWTRSSDCPVCNWR